MKLLVKREYNEKATIGKLFINGIFVADTVEPAIGVGKGPIPEGTYPVVFRTEGSHHESYGIKFPDIHKGMLHIVNVPNFKYILIHIGNRPKDTLGCLLVGRRNPDLNSNWLILDSTITYKQLYKVVSSAMVDGEEVTITYGR